MIEMESSKDYLNIELDCKEYIGVDYIVSLLSNIKNIVKYIANKVEKQSFIKLDVAFDNEDKITIRIRVSASLMQSFIRENNIRLAEKVLESFLIVLELKNHLREGICKEALKINDGIIDIRNVDNESYIINDFIYDIYTEELDQYIKNLFYTYKLPSINLQHGNRILMLNENNINNMKRDVYIDRNLKGSVIKSEIEVNLAIKKPDLTGSSQWEVVNLINNKIIRVIMEDKEFLNKIHLGEILIGSKTTITARLIRETYINEFNEHLKDVYKVRKVINVSRERAVEQLAFN